MNFLFSRPTQAEASPTGTRHAFALFAGLLTWISVNGSYFFPIGVLFALPMACTAAGRAQLGRLFNPATGWRSWLTFLGASAVVLYAHQLGKGFTFGFDLPWIAAHVSGWLVL